MFYIIKTAIRNPKLILDFIYKRHLGVILSIDIQDYISYNQSTVPKTKVPYKFGISKNVEEICKFYQAMGRTSLTKRKISEWLQNGHHCWLAWSGNKVVGGLWIFFGHINLHTLSARVLSKNKNILFDDNIGYKGYVIIHPSYRGKGIYSLFNDSVIKYYYKNNKVTKILLITGASNGAVIKTVMNSHGKLIGIVEVRNICGIVNRKEIFIDPKEKTWR